MRPMADLSPRPGRRMNRAERRQRAYQLTLATGGLGAVAVLGLLLAVFDIIGFGLPILLLVLAVVAGLMLQRTIQGR